MVRKMTKLFTKKQMIQFSVLFIMLFVGSLLELIGVSVLIPLVNMLLDLSSFKEIEVVNKIINLLSLKEDKDIVLAVLAGVIIIYLIKNLYMIFLQYIKNQILFGNRLKMETKVLQKYMHQPYIYHVQHNSSEMQRTILSDVASMFEMMNSVFTLIADAITLVCMLVVLLSQEPIFTLGIMGFLALFLGIYLKVFKKRLYRYGAIAQEYGAYVMNIIKQSLIGIKDVKVEQAEAYFVDCFKKDRNVQINMIKRRDFFQQTPKYLLELICTAGVLMIVFLQVLRGVEVAALFPTLVVFAVVAYKVLPAVNRVNYNISTIYGNKVSVEVLYELLIDDSREDLLKDGKVNDDIEVGEKKQDILLHKVSYKYPGGAGDILDNVSITIKAGHSTAFKGPSGAGKTTTVDLILGLLEPSGGAIYYGEKKIEDLGKAWTSMIGYVPQNVYLNDDTIKNNVAFGVSNPSDEKVWKALEEAQLKDYVSGLPSGIDTIIGENAVRISGGQRQRLGIARALYKDPDIVVLDEATSALDKATEDAVMETINCLKGKKTLIIIAHRLSTIENCEEVFEVKEGAIELVKEELS